MSESLRGVNEHVNMDVDNLRVASDANLHKPFGFLVAANETVALKDAVGDLVWTPLSSLSNFVPAGHIRNCQQTFSSVSIVDIGLTNFESFAKSDDNTFVHNFTGKLKADLSRAGGGGLENGSTEDASTWYAVWLIGKVGDTSTGTNTSVTATKLVDSDATFQTDGVNVGDVVLDTSTGGGTFTKVTSVDSETELTLDDDIFTSTPLNYVVAPSTIVMFSTSFSTIATFPTGYTFKRRIGGVFNNGSSDIRLFVQVARGEERRYYWDDTRANLQVLSGGNATAFSTVDLSNFVPPQSKEATLGLGFDNNNSSQFFSVRPKGFTNTPSQYSPGVSVGGALHNVQANVLTDNSQDIEYLVSAVANGLDIYVEGYTDIV